MRAIPHMRVGVFDVFPVEASYYACIYPRSTSVGRPPRGVVLHADRFNTRPSISLVTVCAEIARLLPDIVGPAGSTVIAIIIDCCCFWFLQSCSARVLIFFCPCHRRRRVESRDHCANNTSHSYSFSFPFPPGLLQDYCYRRYRPRPIIIGP